MHYKINSSNTTEKAKQYCKAPQRHDLYYKAQYSLNFRLFSLKNQLISTLQINSFVGVHGNAINVS